ncbi:ABC transporter permease [Pimelobacter simplex]|uniref:ABC transporter permease n=1 Tax=Nocardioides simplex TaxID=2045 RepID=UPI003AAEA804
MGVTPLRRRADARRSTSHVIGSSGLSVLPAVVAFALAVLAPAAVIFHQSLQPNPLGDPSAAHETWGNYDRLLTDPIYRDVMLRTLRVSVIGGVASVLIGLALVVALTAFRRREVSSVWLFLLVAPILSGPVITVLGWMGLFVEGGLGYRVVNALRPLWGGSPGRVAETEIAMTIGTVHFVVPFVVLTLYPIARTVSKDLLEASLTLGVSPVRTVFRVVLPLCRPGILAASIVGLAMALSAFVNARFLGGERNLVLTTLVSQLVNTFNPTLAAASSVLLVGLGLLLVGIYGRVLSRSAAREVSR